MADFSVVISMPSLIQLYAGVTVCPPASTWQVSVYDCPTAGSPLPLIDTYTAEKKKWGSDYFGDHNMLNEI